MSDYSWHPIHTEVRHGWNLMEFRGIVTILDKFKQCASERSSDIARREAGKEIYELNLWNCYKKDKHVDFSCWNVDISDWNDWWFSPYDLVLLKKYGWILELK